MKRCFKCGEVRHLADFYPHPGMADGHLNKCRDCTKKDVRLNRKARTMDLHLYEKARSVRPERKRSLAMYALARKARNPEKHAARNSVSNAIRDGRLAKQPCEVCGTSIRVEAHHDDYSRPLDVRWLCFYHHRTTAHGQTLVSA